MKKVFLTIVVALSMLIVVACGGNKVEGDIANKYIGLAEEFVQLINEGNFEDAYVKLDDSVKAQFTLNQMEELNPLIEESGSFEEFKKASIEEQDDHYIIIMVAKYSKKDRVYTITYNKADKIAGFYIN